LCAARTGIPERTSSCRSVVASTGKADFASLGQACGVSQSFADILLFKVWEAGQEIANATAAGCGAGTHACCAAVCLTAIQKESGFS
jgi:hypothetical protein